MVSMWQSSLTQLFATIHGSSFLVSSSLPGVFVSPWCLHFRRESLLPGEDRCLRLPHYPFAATSTNLSETKTFYVIINDRSLTYYSKNVSTIRPYTRSPIILFICTVVKTKCHLYNKNNIKTVS